MTFGMRALRTVIAGCAVYYTLVGALLYSAPAFFFARVGHIGAYNAHYERDAGSFIFPYGYFCSSSLATRPSTPL